MNSHPPNSAAQVRFVPKHPILGKRFLTPRARPSTSKPLYFETPTARSRGSVQCLWYLFRYEPLLGTTLPPLSRNFPVIRCNEGRSCTTPQCDTVVTILQGLSGSVGHSLSGVGSTLFGLMALRMHRPDPQVTTTASLTCSSSRSVTLLPGLPR
jgi:hypothetical protein